MLMPKRFAVSAGLRRLSMASLCASSPGDGSSAFPALSSDYHCISAGRIPGSCGLERPIRVQSRARAAFHAILWQFTRDESSVRDPHHPSARFFYRSSTSQPWLSYRPSGCSVRLAHCSGSALRATGTGGRRRVGCKRAECQGWEIFKAIVLEDGKRTRPAAVIGPPARQVSPGRGPGGLVLRQGLKDLDSRGGYRARDPSPSVVVGGFREHRIYSAPSGWAGTCPTGH